MAPPKKAASGMKQGSLFSFFSKKAPPPSRAASAPPLPKPQESNPPVASLKDTAATSPASANQPQQQQQQQQPAQNANLLSQLKVGLSIEVYWSQDKAWYEAKIVKKRKTGYNFFVEYVDDEECEWIDLSTEQFRLVEKSTEKKRRRARIEENDDDDDGEAEFEMADEDDKDDDDDDEFVMADEDDQGKDDDVDEAQLMDTDDEDDASAKSKPSKKRKSGGSASSWRLSTKTPPNRTATSTPATAKSTLSLQSFVAGANATSATATTGASSDNVPPSLTQQQRGSKTPASRGNSLAAVTPATPLFAGTTTTASAAVESTKAAPPPDFVPGALNPAGSHVHNHLAFLQNPRDAKGRTPNDKDYDPRTLLVKEADWKKKMGKPMTDAVKQWWDLKSMYFDTVLLFKTGKFYEMFHSDADIGVQVCGLTYMKGHVAHAGFPEISYGPMSDSLVRAGYKVARVEQTETPEQLSERKKQRKSGPAPKVVNREVCSIVTMGTRTFCYLDESTMLDDTLGGTSTGPLLAIREIPIANDTMLTDSNDETNVQPVCEYGITLVDAIRGSVTIGQFADDVLRSRMSTLLTSFSPSEILLEGGDDGASPMLQSLIRSFQTSTASRIRVETIRPNETFPKSTALDPSIRDQLERGHNNIVHPWDAQETLEELHRRKYYPSASKQSSGDPASVDRWPRVLKAAVEGNAELALSSFGAALYYLQRHLIDAELLSMGIVKAYIPPESASSTNRVADEMQQLAVEQNVQESGVADSEPETVLPVAMNEAAPLEAEVETTYMSLDGTTLHNLEILTNIVDHKAAGSLWSKINFTKTPHGSRLLKAWLLRPLFRKADIERRQDAVEELVSGGAAIALKEARAVLAKCGDIERLLSRIHSMGGLHAATNETEDASRFHPNDRAVLYETEKYTKRKVGDFSKVLNGLRQASQIPELFRNIDIQSGLLRKITHSSDDGGCFPNLAEHLDFYFSDFDCGSAAMGRFEPCAGVDVQYDNACEAIANIIAALEEYKEEMCSTVLKPSAQAKTGWKYVNINPDSKDKYMIELPASINVPANFIFKAKRGQGAKQVNKYRTDYVANLVYELEKAFEIQKERKAKGLELIFARFDSQRTLWAAAAQATALLDALGSLAQAAAKTGYSRPIILDCPANASPSIKVVQGRHPCVEVTFNASEFVPNDLVLGAESSPGTASPRVLLLSGPNMGGKSTLLRQTCLVSILAQIGGFVPAEYCELTPIDRIFTRLGASDRILLNQSTFFVELAETAAALRGASRRSLVIMDELGRGTSTFDGTAIASAAVQHLVERNKCLTLFATHYHSLLEEWKDNPNVALGHMECLVDEDREEAGGDDANITFLYTLGKGVCPKSFAINVARLAGLPKDVLIKAKRISAEFELEMSTAETSQSAAPHAVVKQKRDIQVALARGQWNDVVHLWQNLQE